MYHENRTNVICALWAIDESVELFNDTYISVSSSPSLSDSLDIQQRQHEWVKGQGPGEEVTPREISQFKLGLKLGFTVKIVNPSSPHCPLRQHELGHAFVLF